MEFVCEKKVRVKRRIINKVRKTALRSPRNAVLVSLQLPFHILVNPPEDKLDAVQGP